jgi:hypothetical protein
MRMLLVVGSVFLLSGTLLFGMVYMAIASYAPQMTGWSDPPGRFALAMDATMTGAPYVVGILFMIFGILLLLVALSITVWKTMPKAESVKPTI